MNKTHEGREIILSWLKKDNILTSEFENSKYEIKKKQGKYKLFINGLETYIADSLELVKTEAEAIIQKNKKAELKEESIPTREILAKIKETALKMKVTGVEEHAEIYLPPTKNNLEEKLGITISEKRYNKAVRIYYKNPISAPKEEQKEKTRFSGPAFFPPYKPFEERVKIITEIARVYGDLRKSLCHNYQGILQNFGINLDDATDACWEKALRILNEEKHPDRKMKEENEKVKQEAPKKEKETTTTKEEDKPAEKTGNDKEKKIINSLKAGPKTIEEIKKDTGYTWVNSKLLSMIASGQIKKKENKFYLENK